MIYGKISLQEVYRQRMRGIFYGEKTYSVYEGPQAEKDISMASHGKVVFKPTEVDLNGEIIF